MALNLAVPAWGPLSWRARPDMRKTAEITAAIAAREARVQEIVVSGADIPAQLLRDLEADQRIIAYRAIFADRLRLIDTSETIKQLRARIAGYEREADEVTASAKNTAVRSPEHARLLNEANELLALHTGATERLREVTEEREGLVKEIAKWQ